MKKQLQGIAVILFSILLTVAFDKIGWKYIGDLALMWTQIWLLTGAVGLYWCLRPEKKQKDSVKKEKDRCFK